MRIKLLLAISLVLFLSLVLVDDASAQTEMERQEAIRNQLLSQGGSITPSQEYVACKFWRSFSSGASRTRVAATLRLTLDACENFDANLGGLSWNEYAISIRGAIARDWDYSGTIEQTPFIGVVDLSLGSNNWPWEGMAAVSPPSCPYDISKMKEISPYCKCEDKTFRTSEGGICESASLAYCSNINNCGDNKLISYIPFDESGIFDSTIQKNSNDFAPTQFGHSGWDVFSTFLYVHEEQDDFSLFVNVERSGVFVDFYKVETRNAGWSKDTKIATGELHRTSRLTDSVSLERGWYLLKITYYNGGGSRNLEIQPFIDNQPTNIGDVFKIINSNGPMSIAPEQFSNENEAKWVCENDPYFKGRWYGDDRDVPWDSSLPAARRCCGNNPGLDDNFVAPDGTLCINGAWQSDEGMLSCMDGSQPIPGTHFVPGAGCCGPDTMQASQDSSQQTGCVPLENDAYCAQFNTATFPLLSCTGEPGCFWDFQQSTCKGHPSFCPVKPGSLNPYTLPVTRTEAMCNEVGDNRCRWVDSSSSNNNLLTLQTQNDWNYACMQNRLEINTDDINQWSRVSYAQDANYIWRDATHPDNRFKIYSSSRNDGTHLISDSLQWNICDATNSIGGVKTVAEYQTFEFSTGVVSDIMCTDSISRIFKDEDFSAIRNCDEGSAADCADYTLGPGVNQVFCVHNLGQEPPKHELDTFTQVCGQSCFVQIGTADPQVLDSYIENHASFRNNLCELYPTSSECIVQDSQEAIGIDCIETGTCFIDHTQTCAQITGSSNNICGVSDYCLGGILVDSSDSNTCCVGENAHCQPSEDLSCEAMGGEELGLEDVNDYTCTGVQLQGRETCCLNGRWLYNSINFGLEKFNDAFICYNQQDRGTFKECGPVTTLQNKDNRLNNDAPFSPSGGVIAVAGEPLHSLFKSAPGGVIRVVLADSISRNLLKVDKELNQGIEVIKEFRDWSSFENVRLDLMYNRDNIAAIQIKSRDGASHNYEIKDYAIRYRGVNRVNTLVLPLQQAQSAGVDLTNLGSLNIILKDVIRTEIIYDNIHLEGGSNSDNYYCSGAWRSWVENLDGPTNDGFFFSEPNPADIGPYRTACDANLGYGWTGSLCCGDDTTKDNQGEFFVDSHAACWNGTTIRQDNTVANALGASRLVDHKNLLFFRENGVGRLHTCDVPTNTYNNLRFSFDGVTTHSSLRMSSNMKREDPFTRIGSWMCMSNEIGWIRVTDINRAQVLASALTQVAGNNDYTLFCGSTEDVANFAPEVSNIHGKESEVCALRIHKQNIANENLVVGIAIDDLNLGIEEYFDNYLNRFAPFVDREEISCSESSTKFFSECQAPNNQGFRIYYNKDLNLVLVSDKALSGSLVDRRGMLELWNRLITWFSNLFSTSVPLPLPEELSEFNTKDIYRSVRGDSMIQGLIIPQGFNNYLMKVDYYNLSNVQNLVELFESKDKVYGGQGFVQTIYSAEQDKQNWKVLTSNNRLRAVPSNQRFNLQPAPIEVSFGSENNIINSANLKLYPKGSNIAIKNIPLDFSTSQTLYLIEGLEYEIRLSNFTYNDNQFVIDSNCPQGYCIEGVSTENNVSEAIPIKLADIVSVITISRDNPSDDLIQGRVDISSNGEGEILCTNCANIQRNYTLSKHPSTNITLTAIPNSVSFVCDWGVSHCSEEELTCEFEMSQITSDINIVLSRGDSVCNPVNIPKPVSDFSGPEDFNQHGVSSHLFISDASNSDSSITITSYEWYIDNVKQESTTNHLIIPSLNMGQTYEVKHVVKGEIDFGEEIIPVESSTTRSITILEEDDDDDNGNGGNGNGNGGPSVPNGPTNPDLE